MALLIHPSQVNEANRRGLSWEIRLEHRGLNENNSSGRSSKFWSVETIDGESHSLIVRWGRIGTSGQSQRKPYSEALDRLRAKLTEGYSCVADKFRDLPSGNLAAQIAKPPATKVDLPEPYCRIVTIVLGKAAETFVALDKDNILVMNLSRNGVSTIFEMAPHIRDASPSIIL
jgi:predicted DNA-binding WGR domain protein